MSERADACVTEIAENATHATRIVIVIHAEPTSLATPALRRHDLVGASADRAAPALRREHGIVVRRRHSETPPESSSAGHMGTMTCRHTRRLVHLIPVSPFPFSALCVDAYSAAPVPVRPGPFLSRSKVTYRSEASAFAAHMLARDRPPSARRSRFFHPCDGLGLVAEPQWKTHWMMLSACLRS